MVPDDSQTREQLTSQLVVKAKRRKVKREKSRRGLFLPPLHDDDTTSDVSPSQKLEAALAESRKRRQQRT
ncbi:hypothetical protein [Streptomyces sp. NPDC006134]|uniref:hypothetical protein n=1 Tax=Streptomyces sp. NPDC006134 TaxID=3154467 RepID=UPI0033CCC38A